MSALMHSLLVHSPAGLCTAGLCTAGAAAALARAAVPAFVGALGSGAGASRRLSNENPGVDPGSLKASTTPEELARWEVSRSGAPMGSEGSGRGQAMAGLGGAPSNEERPSWSMPFVKSPGPEGSRKGTGGRFLVRSEGGTLDGWNSTSARPKLGTWPNVMSSSSASPTTAALPEPSILMKEDRRAIVGGVSDMDMIEQYDQVKGTGDLGDNAWSIGAP